MDIYVVSIHLNENGLKEHLSKYECHKTNGGYRVARQSTFGGKTTLVKKEDILRLDSMIRENLYHTLSFYTWYLTPADELTARTLIMDKLLSVANQQALTANKLLHYLR